MKTIILRHAFAVAFALALCCTGAQFAAEPLSDSLTLSALADALRTL